MKVILHIFLDGDDTLDLDVKGIKSDNNYKYKENNIMVNLKIKDDIVYLNRKCSEYDIKLVFDKNRVTDSTYTVFGGMKAFILKTKTKKLIVNDNIIEIEYDLEGNKFKYLLEVKNEGEVKKPN